MRHHRWYAGSAVFVFLASGALAQSSRIARNIDRNTRVTLAGHLHPKARPDLDQGRVAPSMQLPYVTLSLAPSSSQKAALEQLLAQQQDPASPHYHRWLTPEQFADRFGVSNADIAKITNWLQSEGLNVKAVARGRTWIAVSGSAAQFETAFRTELHQYQAAGETHFANATDPSIPAALDGVVHAIRGLNDFHLKPARREMKPD